MLDLVKLNLATAADLTSLQTQITNIINSYNPFIEYVEETSNNGGTFTSGAWATRILTGSTTSSGTHGTSLNTNVITLSANSTYLIKWSAPAYSVDGHLSRLYDVTGAAAILNGTAEFSQNNSSPLSGESQTRSTGVALVTTGGSTKDIRIEHHCETTQSTNGLGLQPYTGTANLTTITLEKLA